MGAQALPVVSHPSVTGQQTSPQESSLASQLALHAPSVQVPEPQSMPQPPQCASFDERSTQVPSHDV
jgi:hypothetical protein